jgi:ubiquinone/menaquinone biosynthesis C-methylase UbiE
MVGRESIREYFDRIAPVWEYWHNRNHFYHAMMRHIVQGMVPPRMTVLELGSGTGDLLGALQPTWTSKASVR